ncbi:hypothetical protein MKW92_016558 [Papaver armeniacum]|nr:hypothetical protein MKW92_016558 [Papaver armeniacum]
MVDAAVSFAVEKLGDALIGETFFLRGVRAQVEGLRDELRRMLCFLKDADAKEQQGDERIRNWVMEIRNLAYDAEDVIDTFLLKVDSTPSTEGIKNLIIRNALMVKNMIHLHRVGKEILAIQARLKAISNSTITYGIKELCGNEALSSETNQRMIQHHLRNRYPHVEDNDVIGFEEYTEILLSELMKEDERRCIVSIVGVGGLGKTTLAKKIYRHEAIKSRFDCCGWSSISEQLNVKDALGEIMKKCLTLTDSELHTIKAMSYIDLVEKLYKYLEDKRYFVVLDDVWEFAHWNSLSPAFPTGKRGSKVLLTTRNKDVALQADPWSLQFEPQHLNDEDSWELLRIKAFPKGILDSNCYPVILEKLGREMVRKCGGLPLGICVLGGLLATKRSDVKEWEFVHSDVGSYINKDEKGGVMRILALSYNDLPCHLKPCFLYLGLFPEDRAIPRKKLIQLWIAEGFIRHTQEDLLSTMEDIGKNQYLGELIQRCMVHVSDDGLVKVCQIHDLMRDLCLSKGKEMNFLDIYNQQHGVGGVTSSTDVNNRKLRRLAIHSMNESMSRYEIYLNNLETGLRTLLVPFGPPPIPSVPLNYLSYKLLRVLDLENVSEFKESVTEEVSKLIHLRYLSLGINSKIPISSSIGNLRNLQTLELPSFYGTLPETTSKLEQLRHLNLCFGSIDPKFRFENLIHLQTIARLKAGNWIRKGCFQKLSNLRRLSVHNTSRLQTDIIIDEVVGKRSSLSSSLSSSSSFNVQCQIPIRNLCIYSSEIFPNSIFDSLSCCHKLHTLILVDSLDIVNLQEYPPNLQDPMATLQYLPKLRTLELFGSVYEGDEMVCSSKGFPQLQYLSLGWLANVKEWRVEKGGMPHLKELGIINVSKLSTLPEGLRFITTLEKLSIISMPLVIERVVEGERTGTKFNTYRPS